MTKSSEKYDYNSSFPTILRALMEERKVTQQKIAEICSVKPQSVSQWRNGETRPDILSLAKIAKHFGVSTDYLLGLTDVKTTDTATKELCGTLGLSENAVSLLQNKIPLYFDFPEISDSQLYVAQTVATLNALISDHIEYLTNANNRNTEEKHSLLQLLGAYLEHVDLKGELIVGNENHQSFTISESGNITILQIISPSSLYADMQPIKELLITQDINKIIAFLQEKNIKGVSRK